jgi:hypothetical protein
MADELGKLLNAFPGEDPLVFELTRPGDFSARLRPRRPKAVKADPELLARLRALCGADAVTILNS